MSLYLFWKSTQKTVLSLAGQKTAVNKRKANALRNAEVEDVEKFSWIFWLLIMKNKKIKRTALLLAFAPAFQKFSCATNYSRPASGVGGRREAVSGRGGRGRGAAASDTCCRLIRIIWMKGWRYTSRPKTNLRVKVVYPNVTKKKLLLARKSIYLGLGIHKI